MTTSACTETIYWRSQSESFVLLTIACQMDFLLYLTTCACDYSITIPPSSLADWSDFTLREQRGVTTDLGSDPTLVRITHTPHLVVHITGVFLGSLQYPLSTLWSRRVRSVFLRFGLVAFVTHLSHSAVFYQDQSKRKETRMILFFVCTKCNHSFMDPSLPTDSRQEVMDEDS